MEHGGGDGGGAGGEVLGDALEHEEVLALLEGGEVHGVGGAGAEGHGVHALDGAEEALLGDHVAHHGGHADLLVASAGQGLHPCLKCRKVRIIS